MRRITLIQDLVIVFHFLALCPLIWDFFRSPDSATDVWELYDMDRDPNELHDLASQDPARLAQLQQQFDEAARRNNVYPLNPDVGRYRREQVARLLQGHQGVFTYSGIVRGISNDAAPPTYRSGYVMRATVDISPAGTQVLVAHGGAMGGYSAYVKDGVLVYCYNLLGGDVTYLRGANPLSSGRHEVLIRFQPDGQGAATVTMQVDGSDYAQGRIPKLTPFMYEASDGFSVGLDQGSAVSPETTGATPGGVPELRFEYL